MHGGQEGLSGLLKPSSEGSEGFRCVKRRDVAREACVKALGQEAWLEKGLEEDSHELEIITIGQ